MNAFGYTALAASREVNLFRPNWIDVNAATSAIEPNTAVHERENRVIATEPDVFTRLKFRAALADNDVPRDHALAAEFFNAKPLANAVSAVFNTALSFFMSHWKSGKFEELKRRLRLFRFRTAADALNFYPRELAPVADGPVITFAAL